MVIKIQRWGNSLALRIPKAFVQEIQLKPGSAVKLSVHQGKLMVQRISAPAFTLEELLKKVTPQNLHKEIETGPPVGRETW